MTLKFLRPKAVGARSDQNVILRNRESLTLLGLILFQIFCTVFFLTDVLDDMEEIGWSALRDAHVLPELLATLGLTAGIIMLTRNLLKLLHRQSQIEESLNVARGALGDVMEGYYRSWGLTASEQDIATFTIKGYSIAEIAELRGSAEATVKTHLNAIYRKSGTSGRGQLTSLLIEDLLGSPLVSLEKGAPARANGRSSAEAAE